MRSHCEKVALCSKLVGGPFSPKRGPGTVHIQSLDTTSRQSPIHYFPRGGFCAESNYSSPEKHDVKDFTAELRVTSQHRRPQSVGEFFSGGIDELQKPWRHNRKMLSMVRTHSKRTLLSLLFFMPFSMYQSLYRASSRSRDIGMTLQVGMCARYGHLATMHLSQGC